MPIPYDLAHVQQTYTDRLGVWKRSVSKVLTHNIIIYLPFFDANHSVRLDDGRTLGNFLQTLSGFSGRHPFKETEMAEQFVLSDALRARLARIPVSAITTVLAARGLPRLFMDKVRPLRPGVARMVGQAFTLRYIPARPDLDTIESFSRPDALQRLALEACPPGFVLVVDARADASIACAGDAFSNRLKMRGCAGIVTDGGLRDVQAIAALDFPAFLQAPAPTPTFVGHHPADYGVPIACGGVPVYPGDVVVGDDDGVVVIPAHLAEAATAAAWEIVAYDEFVDEKLAEGRSLIGLYPATDASREEYRAWRTAQEATP